MHDRPVAFDLSRLMTRLSHATPTGIDRVDLAYARWVLAGGERRFAVLATPLGPRVLRREAAAAILAAVEDRWSDEGSAEDDPVYRDIAARIGLPRDAAPAGATRVPAGLSKVAWAGPRNLARFQGEAKQDGMRFPTPSCFASPLRLRARALATSRGPEALPKGTTYLHTSHLRLDRPRRFAWLARRPDVRAVFFVHDLIPIDHPEFSRPGEDARHGTRLDTIARHGWRVMVNSGAVKRALASHWGRAAHRAPPVTVAPLGIEPPFLAGRGDGPVPAAFFLVCGTIEPRKNHAFLLQIWRRLAEGGGPVPKLVIVGRRGWESESVIDILERASFVRRHVVEAAGLSTPALARLMSQSRAVLMPSFAEGYGLPVAEALSLGTPVVASDIPVHREIADGHALLIDPLDGPAWTRAIRTLSAMPAPPRPAAATPYHAPTWEAHFEIVAAVLSAPDASGPA